MSGPHLWEIRAVRDVVLIALAIGLLWLIVRAQSATVPVLIGFGLAYLADPILKGAKERFGWPRGLSIGLSLLTLLATAVAFTGLVGPVVIHEARILVQRLPRYIEILKTDYGIVLPAVPEALAKAASEPERVADYLQPALGWIGSVVGLTTYTLVAIVLTLAVFAFGAWNYDRLPALQRYFPASKRDRWTEILGKIERVFAGFFRGQLVVAAFTTVVFGVGFFVVGVPYWFLAAAVGGAFSIIPYGQASGWVLAVLLSVLETQAQQGQFDLTDVLVGPTIVYAVMQSLETFVITPLVQGSSTKLHPVAVMAAVVAGGSLGGVVGVFLAIPFVASGKILLQEVLLPRLEHWADEH